MVLCKHCLKDIVCINVLYMLTVLVFVLSMLLMSCLNASHLRVIFISLCLLLTNAHYSLTHIIPKLFWSHGNMHLDNMPFAIVEKIQRINNKLLPVCQSKRINYVPIHVLYI